MESDGIIFMKIVDYEIDNIKYTEMLENTNNEKSKK